MAGDAVLGLGVGSIVHALPSQCSASVRSGPTLTVQYPTAMQSLADVQDTLDSSTAVVSGWEGTASACPGGAVPRVSYRRAEASHRDAGVRRWAGDTEQRTSGGGGFNRPGAAVPLFGQWIGEA